MKSLLNNLSEADSKLEHKSIKPKIFQVQDHFDTTGYVFDAEMSFKELSEKISEQMFEVFIGSKSDNEVETL